MDAEEITALLSSKPQVVRTAKGSHVHVTYVNGNWTMCGVRAVATIQPRRYNTITESQLCNHCFPKGV